MIEKYRIRNDLLKDLRLRNRWSQQKLAMEADLSLGQISRIETGLIPRPHFRTIEAIAGALQIDPDDLIEYL